ncbi:MAG: galactose mutarotase [Ruminococcaceae bacterium]|nr:galactose mutarotase [Oscillospiraceae bacterium]
MLMKREFGKLPNGQTASLYTISGGGLEAHISDLGATLQRLYVPDAKGVLADVVLGFDDPVDYIKSGTFFGTVVGRNSNRTKEGKFTLNGKQYQMGVNDGENNLHSGPDFFKDRLWKVDAVSGHSISFSLESPDGDQGFPGNAKLRVTYTLEESSTLAVSYDAICDQDTVFNLTNHSYFNLAGHTHPEKAMDMLLCMPARFFTVADSASIPTGENRPVDGTPMDFRTAKPIGRDINEDYDALIPQKGYDHNFDAAINPCAILRDPVSGRTMTVTTDCPGLQFYSGNFLQGETGKDGVSYCYRGGICLETQYFPNSLNQPDWPQPITKAGEAYHSETKFIFSVTENDNEN